MKHKVKPFESVIPKHLRKPEIVRIPVKYEPNRSRAGVTLPNILTVKVNGKKLQRRFSSEEYEIKLLTKTER